MKRLMPWLLSFLLLCVSASALAEASVTMLDNLQLSLNEKGELHVDWSASAQEGVCYLVYLIDTGNSFLTYDFFEGVSSCDFTVVPGRQYQVEVYAGPDEASLDPADITESDDGEFLFTPDERLYGNYMGNENCELGWEEVDAITAMLFSYSYDTTVSNKLRDKLDPVTVSKLVDPNVDLFLNFLTTYPEADVSNLTVALYAPDGQCYDKTEDFSQVAVFQQAEGFSMSIADLFRMCADWNESGLAAGEYVIRYALDGQWAGQTSFEVLAD